MRILYAIQGSGRGHLARALEVYPELCRHGDVQVLISGLNEHSDTPFPVKHRLSGLSFLSSSGSINKVATARKFRLLEFWRDIRNLQLRKHYDIVINDFEPVSAWAAKFSRVPCISLSHQWAVQHAFSPKPSMNEWRGISMLKHFAPCTDGYGFHFKSYSKRIYTPIIRREVRALQVSDNGHYTVYLPSYDNTILHTFLQKFDKVHWEVFTPHCHEESVQDNVRIRPLDNVTFLESMASSSGILTSAGFECPAEALYLGKKLMVIPMEDQYEQQCNAASLTTLSVPTIKKISLKYYDRMLYWLSGGIVQVAVDYPDQTGMIIDAIIGDFQHNHLEKESAGLRLG